MSKDALTAKQLARFDDDVSRELFTLLAQHEQRLIIAKVAWWNAHEGAEAIAASKNRARRAAALRIVRNAFVRHVRGLDPWTVHVRDAVNAIDDEHIAEAENDALDEIVKATRAVR